jgi:hypothetical protein
MTAQLPATLDATALTAAVLASPLDRSLRLVLADAITEQTGDYAAALDYAESLQATPEGTERVTVGRAGASVARCGNGITKPIWCTKVYRATRRADGVLTWRLVRSLNDDTAGDRPTGPMWGRAEAYAAERGLDVAASITHGVRCL